jgi:hypothetical protein
MNAPSHELLDRVLAAHGGVERWNSFSKVDTTLVTGGALWVMKGLTQDSAPPTAFQGHEKTTLWDPLHRAYFNSYALWSYLTMPFQFSRRLSLRKIARHQVNQTRRHYW